MPLKLISIILLINFCLLLLMPLSASAEDSDQNKGKIDWKIDRIIEKGQKKENNNRETELEKRFPNLFKEETAEVISAIQAAEKQSIEQLERDLFSSNIEGNTTIEKTKQALFTSDYVAPSSVAAEAEDQEENGNSFNTLLMGGLAALACFVSLGVYILYQRIAN
ncbi:type VII secretion protein EssA [Gracilibacillus boraciitolerans]|nr:type VII secretion protein EssA [Gracilibacillus boraciitolerans]